MTIGFDASRAFTEGRTGTENYSFQLLKHLRVIDTENEYLIYLKKGQETRVKSLGWPKNFKFIEIKLPRLWTQIGLASRTFIDPLDVLFVPSHTLPLIRRPGLKTVITVHDLGSEYLPSFHQLKQVLYLKLMTYYQLKTATKIIAVSEATKKDLIKKVGIKSDKVNVVYEGVDRTIFKKISNNTVNDILSRYNLKNKEYFLFVGTIQPRKNLERLITAFSKFLSEDTISSQGELRIKNKELSKLSDEKRENLNSKYLRPNSKFQLILVGQKGWKSDKIYQLPKELGIESKVKFIGRVPDKDLVGLYNGALALTFPSLFEGFGLPIVEAFATGCPVITSNISSMAEVAGEAGLLVNPLAEEEIAQAMSKMIFNDALKNSLVSRGEGKLTEFDWKKTAEETLKVLKKV